MGRVAGRINWRGWWTVLMCTSMVALFTHVHREQMQERRSLNGRIALLRQQLEQVQKDTNRLDLEIQSQNSSSWIELRLVARLGAVPRGMQKIIFLPKDALNGWRH